MHLRACMHACVHGCCTYPTRPYPEPQSPEPRSFQRALKDPLPQTRNTVSETSPDYAHTVMFFLSLLLGSGCRVDMPPRGSLVLDRAGLGSGIATVTMWSWKLKLSDGCQIRLRYTDLRGLCLGVWNGLGPLPTMWVCLGVRVASSYYRICVCTTLKAEGIPD